MVNESMPVTSPNTTGFGLQERVRFQTEGVSTGSLAVRVSDVRTPQGESLLAGGKRHSKETQNPNPQFQALNTTPSTQTPKAAG